MKKFNSKYDDATIEEIVSRYRAGEAISAISRTMKINQGSVHWWAKGRDRNKKVRAKPLTARGVLEQKVASLVTENAALKKQCEIFREAMVSILMKMPLEKSGIIAELLERSMTHVAAKK